MTGDYGIDQVAYASETDPPRRRPWLQIERDAFARLWADPDLSVSDIAQRLGRTPGGINRARVMFDLPARISPFFIKKIKHQEFYFKLPISNGLKKLLNRSDTLVEWMEEGRDNYELARAFHVPMADVVRAVRGLRLTRPDEYEVEPEVTECRDCSACGTEFQATKYRFRCDPCLGAHARLDDFECTVGGFR